MSTGMGRTPKDIHPLSTGFSERDYDTGWMLDRVREFAWRFVKDGDVKHAVERAPTLYPKEDPRSSQEIYWKYNVTAECRFWPEGPGQWLGTRERWMREIFHDLPRCPDCLKAIGVKVPTLRKDGRRIPNRKSDQVKVNRDWCRSEGGI